MTFSALTGRLTILEKLNYSRDIKECHRSFMPLPPIPTFHPIANPDSIVTAENARITVLTDRLIRLEYSKDDHFEDRPSQVFWHRNQPVPPFTRTNRDFSIEIETDFLRLRYQPGPRGFNSKTLSIMLKGTGVTWKYGMRQSGNLKGTARTLDFDIGTTKLEDGLLSKSGWVVVDDSDSLVFNDSGWLEPRIPIIDSQSSVKKTTVKSTRFRGDKDLYFFGYGTDFAACLSDFTRLAGPIPMIPRYILGNWWSRYWAYTQAELQSLMEEFRLREIPLSVCIIDMDWHTTKTGNDSNGWTGYTWNRELFPYPYRFIHWLHSQGLHTALNLHPAKGVYPHEDQYEQMALWMGIDQNAKQPIPFNITDPHFMEGYFEILHHPKENPLPEAGREARDEDGVDFWWLDWQQGKKSKIPGLDPLSLLNHLHYHDHGRDGRKRPFIFSRWGGLGNHRYPIGFSGDTIVRWRTLRFQPYFTATAANVAYGWWSHDIGGHMFKDRTPELYLRWVQFGVFSPIFRLHATNLSGLDRRPWVKPNRIYQATRHAMQLRHSLIPYIYSMAWRAHCTGISLVTPMYYGKMGEATAYKAKDQYFFGSELLIAPITKPVNSRTGLTDKKVWFPEGTWFNFFNGERIRGGQWHEIQATLEDIPVYAKAGAILPLTQPPAWGGIVNPTELELYIFPGAENNFLLYEDDGETVDYQRGIYALTQLEIKIRQTRGGSAQEFKSPILEFTIHPVSGDLSVIPPSRNYHIHLRGVEPTTTASLPGSYDLATRTFSLDPFNLIPNLSCTVNFHSYQQESG
jgi:alpha-glucosidase (family GH31 glycosyl hydrolase)